MGAPTTNYNLTQYDGSDTPKWRGDNSNGPGTYNGDMRTIESALSAHDTSLAGKAGIAFEQIGYGISQATEKTVLDGGDTFGLAEATSNVSKKITWNNIFNIIKTYFSATDKTVALIDADTLQIYDGADSNVAKKITWALVKSTLKTYFDTLYATVSHLHTSTYAPLAHKTNHEPGGSDAMVVNALAGVGSLRTLSTTSTSAAAGNHTHAGVYAPVASVPKLLKGRTSVMVGQHGSTTMEVHNISFGETLSAIPSVFITAESYDALFLSTSYATTTGFQLQTQFPATVTWSGTFVFHWLAVVV
jgi:hypothetical protein